ncbi:MAG: hypothetical protein RIC30_16250 [Marinoscillum sp.]|uniref:DUF6702 family protein n=1 Tax=Marinoscillum sp. TaxID=2024838 RepID=UPI0033045204
MYLILWLLLHPYHVSVCEIVVDPEATTIQITHRLFAEDLELALRAHTANPSLNVFEDSLPVMSGLKSYFLKNLSLRVNGENMNCTFLRFEVEDDLIWCYLEVTYLKGPGLLDVHNSVLLDQFDDQKNLVHIKSGDLKKSFLLDADTRSASFNLE